MTTSSEFKSAVKSYLKPRNLVRVVVGHSTRFVVATAVTKIVQPEKTADKARTYVGGYVLGAMVSDYTEDYVTQRFDKHVEENKEAYDKLHSAFTETPETPAE